MAKSLTLCVLLLVACGKHTAQAPAPATAPAVSAPVLEGAAVLIMPVQGGSVPSPDSAAHHWPADRAALDTEIAYWLKELSPKTRWFLPELIDRAVARSPGLNVRPHELSVGIFQQAQVKRIGDPLFGDIRKLAAVFDAEIAVVPIAAEYVGRTRETATLQIATAVIELDADVRWFGVIAGTEAGVDSQAAVASAAQAFARAFAARKKTGEN
ncbi:MAG TPA: hypothetical protein VM100_06840 [Longimicrobiales bacterium]|nr:hypothetical protein [Longimicrobiales bacterium]